MYQTGDTLILHYKTKLNKDKSSRLSRDEEDQYIDKHCCLCGNPIHSSAGIQLTTLSQYIRRFENRDRIEHQQAISPRVDKKTHLRSDISF